MRKSNQTRKVFLFGVGAQKAGTSWLHEQLHRRQDADFGFCKEYHILDATFINKIFFLIANLISSSVLPTPEKTILFGLIPDLIALSNSPPETTSAPDPIFFKTFKI